MPEATKSATLSFKYKAIFFLIVVLSVCWISVVGKIYNGIYSTEDPSGKAETSSKVEYRNPQKVYIIGNEVVHRGEMGHIWLDGIENSQKLQLTMDVTDTSAYWICDLHRTSKKIEDLKNLLELSGRDENSTQSKIFFLDISDGFYDNLMSQFAPLAIKYFGANNTYYATRQQVEGRDLSKLFKKEDGFTENSTFYDMGKAKRFENFVTPVGVLRYGVRSDIVKRIEVLTRNHPDLASYPRFKDVASFWDSNDFEDSKHSGAASYLRTHVSRAVQSLNQTHSLNVTVGIIGKMAYVGRNGVTNAYTQALVDHKIIVVAQRDQWEGHYRLMEALAGGALVMTDPMHPLPLMLEDGDGLVVYSSLEELKKKIIYYIDNPTERIKIAKRGYYIAMNYHRSWHIMERLLLGNWTENVYQKVAS